MIRSLYSGVSGMKNHQIRMDVIGNNIANVNTFGFKKQPGKFSGHLYQAIRSASAADADLGGISPSQVGMGMSVSSVTSDMGQGNMQSTGRTLDLAIQGNGCWWFQRATRPTRRVPSTPGKACSTSTMKATW